MSRARSGGQVALAGERLDGGPDRRDRSPELVGHVRNEAPPHRLRAVPLGHVPDDAHGGGLAGRFAVRDGADVDLEDLFGRGLPARRRTAVSVGRRLATDAGREEPKRLRIPHEIDERVPRRIGGRPEEGERGRVRVEERERPVHDEEADGNLLEDGPREKARPLAALALGRDEAGEAGERDEDLLRLRPSLPWAAPGGGRSPPRRRPC